MHYAMTNGGLAGGHSLAHLRRWWVGGLFTHSALNLPLHPTSASAVQCSTVQNKQECIGQRCWQDFKINVLQSN